MRADEETEIKNGHEIQIENGRFESVRESARDVEDGEWKNETWMASISCESVENWLVLTRLSAFNQINSVIHRSPTARINKICYAACQQFAEARAWITFSTPSQCFFFVCCYVLYEICSTISNNTNNDETDNGTVTTATNTTNSMPPEQKPSNEKRAYFIWFGSHVIECWFINTIQRIAYSV